MQLGGSSTSSERIEEIEVIQVCSVMVVVLGAMVERQFDMVRASIGKVR